MAARGAADDFLPQDPALLFEPQPWEAQPPSAPAAGAPKTPPQPPRSSLADLPDEMCGEACWAARQGGADPPINVQKQAGHVPGTPQHANRVAQGKITSSFFDAEQGEAATREAWQKGTPLGADGKMRLHDFGRPVGVGPHGGYQTQVRASIDSGGKIHGSPWGPVFKGPLRR